MKTLHNFLVNNRIAPKTNVKADLHTLYDLLSDVAQRPEDFSLETTNIFMTRRNNKPIVGEIIDVLNKIFQLKEEHNKEWQWLKHESGVGLTLSYTMKVGKWWEDIMHIYINLTENEFYLTIDNFKVAEEVQPMCDYILNIAQSSKGFEYVNTTSLYIKFNIKK